MRASEQFQMGVREARRALTGGGLLASVNLERRDQLVGTIESRDPYELAAALHSMAGPFNVRMLSKDIDSPLMGSAEIMSTRLAAAVFFDVLPGHVDCDVAALVPLLCDALCGWIDFATVEGRGDESLQSVQAAQLMAKTLRQDIHGSEAAASRLHALLRFAPALGVIETVVRLPVDHPSFQTPSS